jgi:hypothetical protein
MASRSFNQFCAALEKARVEIFAKITFGAAGAPTLVTAASKGVASVTRNSTGNYTLTLSDQYYGLLGFSGSWLVTGFPSTPNVALLSVSLSSKTLQFMTGNDEGNLANPSSGETLYLKITLSNTSAI